MKSFDVALTIFALLFAVVTVVLLLQGCAPKRTVSTMLPRGCTSSVLGSDGLFHCSNGQLYDAGCVKAVLGSDGNWHCSNM